MVWSDTDQAGICSLATPLLYGGAILSGILPFAVMADGGRYARLRYYQYLKASDT